MKSCLLSLEDSSSKMRVTVSSPLYLLGYSRKEIHAALVFQTLKSQNIRVSVIGLAAEVRICSALCRETGGTYSVVLDDRHFRDLLFQHVEPPPATLAGSQEASLIKMGFPHHEVTDSRSSSLTMCMW